MLRQVEAHDVAAAGGNDRVDSRAGDVCAEHLAPAHRPVGIRSVEDVPPRARDRKKFAEMAEDSNREPLPLDFGEVVEEDSDRVEDGVDH